MAHKFQPGDRVICNAVVIDSKRVLGKTGTILDTSSKPGTSYAVRWDEKLRAGHDCGGRCEDGYGWYVNENAIELLCTEDMPVSSEAAFNAILFG